MFNHIDDYASVIQTRIARPALIDAPEVVAWKPDGLLLPADAERWPPERAPLGFWGSASVLAQHCAWLRVHVPGAYLRSYWEAHRAAPGIGHLHLLYDNAGYHHHHGACDIHSAGIVDLPADLCICDCPMLGAAESHPDAVPRLLSRCITEVFRWHGAFALADVRGRLPASHGLDRARELLVVVACCHWLADDCGPLEGAVRDAQRHAQWVPALLEAVGGARFRFGTNRSPPSGVATEFDGLLLQVAFLLSPACPLSPPALVPKFAAMSLDTDDPHLWAAVADACVSE